MKILKILATILGLCGGLVISFKSLYVGYGFVLLFSSSLLWIWVTYKMKEKEMWIYNFAFGMINLNGVLQWLADFNVFSIIQSYFA